MRVPFLSVRRVGGPFKAFNGEDFNEDQKDEDDENNDENEILLLLVLFDVRGRGAVAVAAAAAAAAGGGLQREIQSCLRGLSLFGLPRKSTNEIRYPGYSTQRLHLIPC